VRPRRQWLALLCGPSASPLEGVFTRRLSLFVLLGAISAGAWAEPSIEELTRSLARDGAETVVRRLFDDQSTWNAVMARISSGDHRWVSFGISLLAKSDAGASEELHDAMFLALANDPAYLLSQPKSENFDINEVCAGRSDPPEMYKEAEAEQLAVRAKVAALSPKLGKQRDACLPALDSGLKDIRRYFGVQP